MYAPQMLTTNSSEFQWKGTWGTVRLTYNIHTYIHTYTLPSKGHRTVIPPVFRPHMWGCNCPHTPHEHWSQCCHKAGPSTTWPPRKLLPSTVQEWASLFLKHTNTRVLEQTLFWRWCVSALKKKGFLVVWFAFIYLERVLQQVSFFFCFYENPQQL